MTWFHQQKEERGRQYIRYWIWPSIEQWRWSWYWKCWGYKEKVQQYVINGGYLLHRVVSDKQSTFGGCQDGPSTKDHEHAQKIIKPKKVLWHLCSFGKLDWWYLPTSTSGNSNKQCFIELLLRPLSSNGHVLQCCAGVDTSIVSTFLYFACARENVCLIAAGTDLLIMLIYMWNNMMGRIKMKNEDTQKYKVSVRVLGRLEVL